MKSRFLIVAASALALAACGGNDADEAMSEGAGAEATAASTEAAPPDATDPQTFVDTMAASDMFEIEAGKIAQEMGKSEKVKAFGEMMVADHTKSSDKLKAAVAEAGNGLTVTPALDDLQQGKLEQLRTAGQNFDALYAQQQVNAHEEALDTLQTHAQGGTLEPLKAFAAETATVVEGHLSRARELP